MRAMIVAVIAVAFVAGCSSRPDGRPSVPLGDDDDCATGLLTSPIATNPSPEDNAAWLPNAADLGFIRDNPPEPGKYDARELLRCEGPTSRVAPPIEGGITMCWWLPTLDNRARVERLLSSRAIPFFMHETYGWRGATLFVVVPRERYREAISVLKAATLAGELPEISEGDAMMGKGSVRRPASRPATRATTGAATTRGFEGWPEHLALVRGAASQDVAEEAPYRGLVHYNITVNHVYVGNEVLRGQTFRVLSGEERHDGPGRRVGGIMPPLQEGEEGIWLVDETGRLRACEPPWALPFRFPVRSGIDPRYPQALAVARALEALANTEGRQRTDLLQWWVTCRIPELAWCAAMWLALEDPDGPAWLMQSLRNDDLPLLGQVGADEGLCRVLGKSWVASSDRLTAMEGWVARKQVSDYEAGPMIAHLDIAMQARLLEPATSQRLLATAASNDGMSEASRRWACDLAKGHERRAAEIAAMVEDNLIRLERGSDLERQRLAAWYLKSRGRLEPGVVARLRVVRGGAKDAELARLLDDILAAQPQ